MDFKIQRYYVRNNWFLKQSIRILYTINRLPNEFTRNEILQIAQTLMQICFEIEPEHKNLEQLHEYNRLMRFLSETICNRLYVNDKFRSIIVVHSDEVVFRFIRRAIHYVNALGKIDKETNKSVCYILFREQVKNQTIELVSKNVRNYENGIRSNFDKVFATNDSLMATIRYDLERFRFERQREQDFADDEASRAETNDDNEPGRPVAEPEPEQPQSSCRQLCDRKQLIVQHLNEVQAEIRKQRRLRQRQFWEKNRDLLLNKLKEVKLQKLKRSAIANANATSGSAGNDSANDSDDDTASDSDHVPCTKFNAAGDRIETIDKKYDFYDDVPDFEDYDCKVREPFDFELFDSNRWPTFQPNTIEAFVSQASFVNLKKFYRLKKMRKEHQLQRSTMRRARPVATTATVTSTITSATANATTTTATIDELLETITAEMSTKTAMSSKETTAGTQSLGRSMPGSSLGHRHLLFKRPKTPKLSDSVASESSLDSIVSQCESMQLTSKRKHSSDRDSSGSSDA